MFERMFRLQNKKKRIFILGNWYEVSSLDVTGWVSAQPLRENLHEAQVELEQFFKNGSLKKTTYVE
jgi:hypothetical protein